MANHTPLVLVVDEVSTREEAAALRSIAQRGVGVLASVHATHLGALLRDREVDMLLGGSHEVVVSDLRARR